MRKTRLTRLCLWRWVTLWWIRCGGHQELHRHWSVCIVNLRRVWKHYLSQVHETHISSALVQSSGQWNLSFKTAIRIIIIVIIMVIFKCLSLKAVSAIQGHEGGGGNKNNYTNVSLRLCIIIHRYIDAQSHLLHTHTHTLSLSLSLSLPLSLPLPLNPHTRTHHTAHTHLHRANQADMS